MLVDFENSNSPYWGDVVGFLCGVRTIDEHNSKSVYKIASNSHTIADALESARKLSGKQRPQLKDIIQNAVLENTLRAIKERAPNLEARWDRRAKKPEQVAALYLRTPCHSVFVQLKPGTFNLRLPDQEKEYIKSTNSGFRRS